MVKRILSVFISAVIVFSCCTFISVTVSAEEYGGFIYTVKEDLTVKIDDYTGEEAILDIPDTIDGKPVTEISMGAFSGKQFLTRISIPDSVTVIGRGAFSSCENLTNAVLSENLTEIPASMFERCYSLRFIEIPEGVTVLRDRAFAGCLSLTGAVLPSTLTTIEEVTFWSCENLKMYVPETVTNISSNQAIGYEGYYDLMENFTMYCASNSAAEHYAQNAGINYETTALTYDDVAFGYYSYSEGLCVDTYYGNEKTVTLPSHIMGEPVAAFSFSGYIDHDGAYHPLDFFIEKFIIPAESLPAVETTSFISCANLKELEIQGNDPNYREVDGSIYSDGGETLLVVPTGAESIAIADGTKKISDFAFRYHEKLTEVTLPEGLISIGQGAFARAYTTNDYSNWKEYGCNITEIELPSTLVEIGKGAFAGSDITQIALPASLTSLGENAFFKCYNLTAFEVAQDNTAFTSVDGVLYNKDMTELINYPVKKYGAFTVPESVTHIREYAAAYNDGITELTLGKNVEFVGRYAFFNSESLKVVTVLNNYLEIDAAFTYDYSQRNISYPTPGLTVRADAVSRTAYTARSYVELKDVLADEIEGIDYIFEPLRTIEEQLHFDNETGIVSGVALDTYYYMFFDDVVLKSPDGSPIPTYNTRPLATGDIINYKETDYLVAIKGDTTRDGKINSTDFMQVRKHFLGLYEMTEVQKASSDVNGDRKINSTDFMQIRKHFLGLYNMYA